MEYLYHTISQDSGTIEEEELEKRVRARDGRWLYANRVSITKWMVEYMNLSVCNNIANHTQAQTKANSIMEPGGGHEVPCLDEEY